MIVHLLAHNLKWELVCKFGVRFRMFIIICLLGSRFHAWDWWFFYSIMTFSCTKYSVHSYTVDVVFTLSYAYYHPQVVQMALQIWDVERTKHIPHHLVDCSYSKTHGYGMFYVCVIHVLKKKIEIDRTNHFVSIYQLNSTLLFSTMLLCFHWFSTIYCGLHVNVLMVDIFTTLLDIHLCASKCLFS